MANGHKAREVLAGRGRRRSEDENGWRAKRATSMTRLACHVPVISIPKTDQQESGHNYTSRFGEFGTGHHLYAGCGSDMLGNVAPC